MDIRAGYEVLLLIFYYEFCTHVFVHVSSKHFSASRSHPLELRASFDCEISDGFNVDFLEFIKRDNIAEICLWIILCKNKIWTCHHLKAE